MCLRYKTILFLSLLFAFSACKSKKPSKEPKANPPVKVDVLIAGLQSISNIVEANGVVIANEYVELRPEVSGRLTFLNVPEGNYIEKGTIIARINDADLRAQIGKSQVQLDLAEKTLSRYKQLLDVNGINQSDYDATLNQVNSYKADIAYTQALVDKTIVRAPFSGVIGLRQVSPGAFVTSATIIATLQQVTQAKIDFTLPDSYGNIIKKGGAVDVELDAVSQKVKAIIIATEPGANTATRNLKVRAILQGGTASPGAFVKVYVDAGKNRKAIKVPTNCIIPDDKNNQVVIVKDGKAAFIDVQTGIREANTVEIVKGINVGDSVVVTGVLFTRPKSVLKISKVKKLEELVKASNE